MTRIIDPVSAFIDKALRQLEREERSGRAFKRRKFVNGGKPERHMRSMAEREAPKPRLRLVWSQD